MPRPLSKMDKERIKYVIENPQSLAAAEIARRFGVHHTTIIYWQKKLAREGFRVNKGRTTNETGLVLSEIKKELGK